MFPGRRLYYFFAGFLLWIVSACSNTRFLPPGEALYTGAKIEVNGPVSHKKKKAVRKELASFTRPRQNRTILGLRVRLFAYNIAGHPKKEKSPGGWLKKFGEPPVLLSEVNLDRNVKVLQSTVEMDGYFKTNVTGDTIIKRKRATAVYKVETDVQYTIKQVVFETDSTPVQQAILKISPYTLLKAKEPFDLDIIKAERLRIDAYLKENGFYFFNPDFLIIWADSNAGNNQVNLYVKLKPGIPADALKVYTINDIFIYSNYSLRAVATDTTKNNTILYDGYYIADKDKLYKPRMFDEAMQFNTYDVYNRTDHNQSLNRLINLGVFKFVKNRFEVVPGIDSPKLNAYYYLTPFPKKSVRVEVLGTTKSDNLAGSQISIDWRNRNTLRGGELLSIKAYGGIEVQYSGQFKGYNIYRAGVETNFSFPRYLIPFYDITTKGAFMPKTNIELGYDLLNKRKLYTLNSFRGALSYLWKENIHKEHKVSPFSINYVQPVNVTQRYTDSAKNNLTLRKAIDKQFILGSMYNFNYNDLLEKQPSNGMYFNGNLDLSGNIAGLITGANARKGKVLQIFNAEFSQYIRAEAEFRYYTKLNRGCVLANRIIAGLGYPYGNSLSLPFIKQFFSGGNNSLRGFRSRSVGPGTYLPPDFGRTTFLPDQSGDIKLELNTELRQKLFSIVEGAVFIDAGNVWLYNKDTSKPGGQFSENFLKELAVNTGIGIRLDVSILILRLDVAFPLRKPYLPDGQRWVIDKIDFASGPWRSQNLVFNIGIGYPF